MFIKIKETKLPRLYVNCYGKGDPTVVFESGLGCTHFDWEVVQNQISKNTRTFSCDRAGLGNSDTGDLPRSSLDQVHELHTVLNKAKVKAHYIIVAHSIGGYNARLFAGTYPKEVSGIVFVDCSHENQFEDRVKRSSSKEIEIVKSQSIGTEQTFDELLISAKQVSEIREKDALRNIPIIVLTADHKGETSAALTEEAWLKYQGDLVTLSDYSKHIIVEECGHFIQKDKPQVVIDAIKGIVNGMSK
ncbi:alpha/beta fold hydrolase [Clostridium tagluense]|uniref:alpha/beta fold hydrolase n=1 Tax=Clostridium tagluense TaxID=360422 RepID=UPI001C6DE4C4|nr:alpha/beta hydrolase [Clostridium tagluense]MBW9158211.1 alpha/beta hydrolase [Clostridium tagluense]WLC67532.1 alpha/beta hydrolase [Clostridium tagluense]